MKRSAMKVGRIELKYHNEVPLGGWIPSRLRMLVSPVTSVASLHSPSAVASGSVSQDRAGIALRLPVTVVAAAHWPVRRRLLRSRTWSAASGFPAIHASAAVEDLDRKRAIGCLTDLGESALSVGIAPEGHR